MEASVIWVRGNSAEEPLVDFADLAKSALGLTHVEERKSSNYWKGHYFRGVHDGAEVKVYYLDTVGLEDYLFVVQVDPGSAAHAATLARLLSRLGRFCFVPTGPWHLTSWDRQGVAYDP
jgi:hypothetical protein